MTKCGHSAAAFKWHMVRPGVVESNGGKSIYPLTTHQCFVHLAVDRVPLYFVVVSHAVVLCMCFVPYWHELSAMSTPWCEKLYGYNNLGVYRGVFIYVQSVRVCEIREMYKREREREGWQRI